MGARGKEGGVVAGAEATERRGRSGIFPFAG